MAIHTIICPLDFSPNSYLGLKHAVALSTHYHSELCLLHVEVQRADQNDGQLYNRREEAERSAEIVSKLCEALENRVPVTVRSRPLLKRGDTILEITRAAHEEKADLIVLSARGQGGTNYVGALGSVTKGLLLDAPCPVVVVQSQTEKSEATSHA